MRNRWELLKREERVHSLSLSLTILGRDLKSWSMQIVDRVTTQFVNSRILFGKLRKQYASIFTHFQYKNDLNNSDVLLQFLIAFYFEYIMDDQFSVSSVC